MPRLECLCHLVSKIGMRGLIREVGIRLIIPSLQFHYMKNARAPEEIVRLFDIGNRDSHPRGKSRHGGKNPGGIRLKASLFERGHVYQV